MSKGYVMYAMPSATLKLLLNDSWLQEQSLLLFGTKASKLSPPGKPVDYQSIIGYFGVWPIILGYLAFQVAGQLE